MERDIRLERLAARAHRARHGEPPPLLLIDRGRVLKRHLRMELMSEEELKSKLREHGVADPREVDKAYIEPDGQVTVIKRREHAAQPA